MAPDSADRATSLKLPLVILLNAFLSMKERYLITFLSFRYHNKQQNLDNNLRYKPLNRKYYSKNLSSYFQSILASTYYPKANFPNEINCVHLLCFCSCYLLCFLRINV